MDHSGFSHLILPFFQPANSRGSLLPSYELWVTLHGGNGRWQQVHLTTYIWRLPRVVGSRSEFL